MPKLRLTAAAVDRFQPPSKGQVEYYDTYLPAFGLRISSSGTKAWFVMVRFDGKLTRLTLGRFPGLGLSEARNKARHIIDHAKAGVDPRDAEDEERRRKERERQNTFEATAALFMQSYAEKKLRPNTTREYRRVLQGTDTKEWRSKSVGSLTKQDVVSLLCRIEQRGSPAAANRALAYLSKFFNWCVEQDFLVTSPAIRVRPISPTRSRDRVLSDTELAWIWRTLESFPRPFGPLFQLLVLTGQRRSEVAGMQWRELRALGTKGAVWDLPGERTKNGQPHLVPLVPRAETILMALPRTGSLIFTTTGENAVSGFSKAKRLLDKQIADARAEAGLAPLEGWTLHDLRRTLVTIMNEQLGTAPHVVEAIVNHLSGSAKRGVAGVYNRALYLVDRRQALENWSTYVHQLSSEHLEVQSNCLQEAKHAR